jgi:Icc-related predicted phosphoesterase
MRIFFATDLHGSDICFRKFCAAADFYNCDALILGGDLTGKMLVPVRRRNSEVEYDLGGVSVRMANHQLEAVRKRIANMGYYAVVGDDDELHALDDPGVYEGRLLQESLDRAREWVGYAEEHLNPRGISILVAPGNDDHPQLDGIFAASSSFQMAEQKVVMIDSIEIITTGWSNPTPWRTPRECTEDELEARLRQLVGQLTNPRRAIYNIHVPPHNTSLDICPKLDEKFSVVTIMGNPVLIHAGSIAVRKVIEETQPVVSLHGHIHESRNVVKLGRTLAINPGSEYGEGVLMGSIVTVKGDQATQTFTAG